MSGRHATAADLESYVLGALDPERIESFEAHCAECDACAAALAGEARLEVAFEQVARRPVRVASPRPHPLHPLRAAAYGAAGLVAMAAAVVLWFGHSPASATAAAAAAAGEAATPAVHHAMDDGAILDARNDALDGG
jgi:anti-sigma factor RsiW